jgi:hypothetical protein
VICGFTILSKMDPENKALQTAVRVLMALGSHRIPEPSDVEQLKSIAPLGYLLGGMPLEEMACDVIMQAMKQRAALRAARLGATGD